MSEPTTTPIGGDFCKERIPPGLIPRAGQQLTPRELGVLWVLFQAIGYTWKTLHPAVPDSSTLKSSWLEFIEAKSNTDPSYVAEYANAVMVIEELRDVYGDEAAELTMAHQLFTKLLLDNGIPPGDPATRIAHTKKYVIDEFIRVHITISGFKSFGPNGGKGRNYKGYLGGSRYNLRARVRSYDPDPGDERR